ncbi:MAG TPA: oligoendopeptidase F [Anaeromyxobacteraceae bacterium]|nr:oligoendopeptidase F [Anaeromyxobacteraceae bacterium]
MRGRGEAGRESAKGGEVRTASKGPVGFGAARRPGPWWTVGAALLLALSLPARAAERSEVPEEYRWNLAELYPSEAAFRADLVALRQRIPQLELRQGHLGDSPSALLAALDLFFGLDRDLERLTVYATGRADEDTRRDGPRQLREEAEELRVALDAASAFVKPELLALGPSKVRGLEEREPRLAPYHHFLDDALRFGPHTLSAAEEQVAAEAGRMSSAGRTTFGILTDAELPYPTVKLSTGEELRMDETAFVLHRADRERKDRDLAFTAFLGTLAAFKGSLGSTLYAQVQANLFDAKVHRFGSTLEDALFKDAIPVEVYRQLLRDVRRSLPTFHRYLSLKKRLVGLATLRYQDLYLPMVARLARSYSPQEAQALVLEAVAPLGPAYTAALRHGFENRWTDLLPSTGKRTGAYSTSVYGLHPYQLLNFNGTYADLSALAHESGHSLHSWLAMRAQPYPTAAYPIFVAEVASTLNENLLVHSMLGKARDDAERLFLLSSELEGLRTTLFRQAQFAEFELGFHEMVERGEPLTGDNLSALYLRITRAYYGHDEGVCEVPELIASEWAMVPHFYREFYVYQYATSLVAAMSISKAIREEAAHGETLRRDAFLRMLSSGGASYPIELLREAGVDMTTSAPFDAAIAEMNAVMDDLEQVLARHGGRPPAP